MTQEWTEYRVKGDDFIPVEKWGQDHWSTFLYFETLAVDYKGIIDNRRMRCSARLHRHFAHSADGSQYPTLLKGGKADNHDDWSCLEDMVAAGLLLAWFKGSNASLGETFGGSSAKVELTDRGWKVAGQLRKHRAGGGKYEEFEPGLANYDRLLQWFLDKGYEVETGSLPSPYAFTRGHGIRAEFSGTPEWGFYTGSKIAADNERCFDKPSNCPLVMRLPVDLEELERHLTWLATEAGFKYSNGYLFYDDPKLPREIDPE